jgi:hypothetical protein
MMGKSHFIVTHCNGYHAIIDFTLLSSINFTMRSTDNYLVTMLFKCGYKSIWNLTDIVELRELYDGFNVLISENDLKIFLRWGMQ